MSGNSSESKVVPTARCSNEVVKIAVGGSDGFEAAMPNVLAEVQNG